MMKGLIARTLIALATAAMLATSSAAQEYPIKPVRIIVAFSPGSGNDVIARELARLMHKSLGQPVIVENRVGAGGTIGTDAVAKAAPDGYTIGLGTSSQLVMNVGLNEVLPFNVDKDLMMIGLVTRTPLAMVAGMQAPKNVKELIETSKAKPGSINYGSGGNGSISHIVAEAFARKAGIEMTHIPYKGNAAALTDVAGGSIQILFDGVTAASALEGKVRVLAIADDKRHPDHPDVPTFAEAGVPGYEAYTWNCLFAPAGTPQPIIDKLNAALNQALTSPTVVQITARNGGKVIGPSTPGEAAAFAAKERAQWVPFIKAMQITN
jgi:tripartite-type tricarboxylate transporter receptor subunit TctC